MPIEFRCSKRTGLESGEKNSKESKCPLFQILENGENELNGVKMSTLYELGEIGEKELNGREMSTPYELGESGEKELNGRDVSTLYELVESGEIELNRIEVSTLHELEGVKKMNSTRQAIKEASNCASHMIPQRKEPQV